jgi:hypothetical protein
VTSGAITPDARKEAAIAAARAALAELIEIATTIPTQELPQTTTPPNREDDKSTFEKIKRYLESVGNKPLTTTELRNGAGVSRGSVSNVLYTSHSKYFECFDQPGTNRKLWALKPGVAETEEFAKLVAHECCRRILSERGNTPMHILSLAKESVRRGYHGKGKYEGDSLIWVTAKSFWARLSAGPFRVDFEQVKPNVFRLKQPTDEATGKSSLFVSDYDPPQGEDESLNDYDPPHDEHTTTEDDP